jgi:UDP-glucose-4-epimerase GalE
MKKILITGGAGYIGSQTSKLLALDGYEPVCFDDLSTGHAEFVKWGPLEIGDLHDCSKITKIIKHYQPICVIHFAGNSYVGESISNPQKYYHNNVGGTLSLLNAMQNANSKNLIFSSSCTTYGVCDGVKIDETTIQKPINPYGKSKLMVEKILFDLANQGKLSQITLRYFNAAGADKDCEIGAKHNPETRLIPLAINSAKDGTELEIFGTDFPTKDKTAIRDYVHVEDLGRAHILAMKLLLSKNINSDFINLGSGIGSSVLEIINNLKKLGLTVNSRNMPRRIGDPASLVADISKAKKVLNWEPNYNITEILQSAILWNERQLNLKKH